MLRICKLKLDLNFATSEIFTGIKLDKALPVKPEKSISIVTKLKFDFCSRVFWDDELNNTGCTVYSNVQKKYVDELKHVLQRPSGENVLEKLFAYGTALCPSECV